MLAHLFRGLVFHVIAGLQAEVATAGHSETSIHDERMLYGFEADSDDSMVSLLQRNAVVVKPNLQNGEDWETSATTKNTARGTAYTFTSVVYGKYFEMKKEDKRNKRASRLYIYSPKVQAGADPRPLVMHFHGGGFIGGDPLIEADPDIEAYLDNGIVYVSVDYRVVGPTYMYEDAQGRVQEEEFVDVSEDGQLSLDPSKVASEYKVVTGWQELIPKCIFDAATALDYLLKHADDLLLDPQRIGFIGDSSGGAAANYLTLVYPKLPGVAAYTVVALTLLYAQLDYPTLPLLDAGWKLWSDDVGEEAPLSTVTSKEGCAEVMGKGGTNPKKPDGTWCPTSSACNASWSDDAAARFCGDDFATTTLGDLSRWYTWPTDTAFERGITKIWYSSSNLAALQRTKAEKPLLFYVMNKEQSQDLNGLTHAAFWARAYARVLEGMTPDTVQFVVWYKDYPGMPVDGKGTEHVGEFNYRSNMDWLSDFRASAHIDNPPYPAKEMLMLHCRGMGLTCSV